jgi:Hypervirulence associated proteins TUDOR domain
MSNSASPPAKLGVYLRLIIKVHTKNVAYKGYTHHASKEDPQYEIKSDKTDHIAMHKGSALKKAND